MDQQRHKEQRREVLRKGIGDAVRKFVILKTLDDIESRLQRLEEKEILVANSSGELRKPDSNR